MTRYPCTYVVQKVGDYENRIRFQTGNLKEAKAFCRKYDKPENPLSIVRRRFICFGNEVD